MEKHSLGITREHLSPDFLFSAYSFAEMALKLEGGPVTSEGMIPLQHRTYVMASILSSVAFLEATINELFYVASDKLLGSGRLSKEYRNLLSPIWTVEKFRKGARILEKYQTALLLLNKEPFEEGKEPYHSTKLSIDIRNALVHYVPETNEITLDQCDEDFGRLEKKLKGKFKTNPFSKDFPVIASSHPDKRAKYPFFPERCLSYGCSEWAARSSLSFVDSFFDRINVTWHYKEYVSKLPKLKQKVNLGTPY